MEAVRVISVPANQFPISRTVIYSLQQLEALLEAEVPKLPPDYYEQKFQQLKKQLPHLSEQDVHRMMEGPPPDMRHTPKSQYEACIKCLDNAGLDFQQDALVLLYSGDSSISTRIWVETEYLSSKTLICKLQVRRAEIGLCAMLACCFAVIVRKEKVSQIEVWADNQIVEVFSVG